ncbi:MAG: hypothetical protein ACJ8FS_00670 [Sphingomicrobium sp.]
MKLFFGVMVFLWLICGFAGSWWLGDHHWKTIAKGPISLVKALNDNPPNYPGPS